MIYFIMIFILFLTSDNIENNRPIVLPTVEVEVEMERITEKEEKKPNLHVIGKQETQIHGSAERILNIKRVVEKLNGVKIERGETFSFNARVGERTKENGFFPAPEIFMGTLTEGVGGGTCQVSSTLFGAALRAGMKIVERRAHSRLSDYVGPGWDAMVALNEKEKCEKDKNACSDLKFKNEGDDVAILARVEGSKLIIEIMGEEGMATPKVRIVWISKEREKFKTKMKTNAKMEKGAKAKEVEKGKDGMTGFLFIEPRKDREISIYKKVDRVLEVPTGWKGEKGDVDGDGGVSF